MNIKIKLKNPKHCNGCPLLSLWHGYSCDLDYFHDLAAKKGYVLRPQKCVEENE